MANKFIEYLRGSGAGADNPASVHRHTPPDLTQTDVYKSHQERQKEAAMLQGYTEQARKDVEAVFKAQDDFLGQSKVVTNTHHEAVLEGSVLDMNASEKIASAIDLIERRNLKDGDRNKVYGQRITNETFDALVRNLPTNVAYELKRAYNHPKEIGKLDLEVLMDIKDSANSLDSNSNFKSGHARPVRQGGWLAMSRESKSDESDDGISDPTMRAMGNHLRDALRIATKHGNVEWARKEMAKERFQGEAKKLVEEVLSGRPLSDDELRYLNKYWEGDRSFPVGPAPETNTDGSWDEDDRTHDNVQTSQHYTSWRRVR